MVIVIYSYNVYVLKVVKVFVWLRYDIYFIVTWQAGLNQYWNATHGFFVSQAVVSESIQQQCLTKEGTRAAAAPAGITHQRELWTTRTSNY